MKIYELPAYGDTRKSFYGKAHVVEENGEIKLLSYATFVAKISNGKFVRLWDGYSATTMRHVNAFLKFFDMEGGGKKWWSEQEVAV